MAVAGLTLPQVTMHVIMGVPCSLESTCVTDIGISTHQIYLTVPSLIKGMRSQVIPSCVR